MSAPALARAKVSRTPSSPIMNGSRFRQSRPQQRVWCVGSMKSGPTLKGWTTKPLAVSAAISPVAIVVLPAPLVAAPTTILGIARAPATLTPAPSAGARP